MAAWRCSIHACNTTTSVKPLREMFIDQLLKAASGAQSPQDSVQRVSELRIGLRDGNANTVAEVLGFQEWAALELAAALRLRSSEPEQETYAVVENQIDFAGQQSLSGQFRAIEFLTAGVAEEHVEIGFVRCTFSDSNAPAVESVGRNVELGTVEAAGEPGGGIEVAVGELYTRQSR